MKFTMKLNFFFTFFFVLVFQHIAANNRYYFSGQLTCNLISDICQDSQDYIWISTEYGLNKFDGNHFTHYLNSEGDPSSLIDNSVRKLYVDKEKRLWICCSRGVQYYIPEEDAFYTLSFKENEVPHIMDIIQLESGEIWLLDSRKGLFEVDKENQLATKMNRYATVEVPPNSVFIYQDMKQRFWVGTSDNGLWMYDPTSSLVKHYGADVLYHNWMGSILEDQEGTLFVSTSVGVLRWDEDSDRFVRLQFEGKRPFRPHLRATNEGGVYVTTYGDGIFYVDKQADKVLSLTYQQGSLESVESAKISAMLEDRQGNLWIGSFQRGLLYISDTPNLFTYWGLDKMGLSERGALTTLYVDKDENVWGAIDGNGIFMLDGNGNVVKEYMQRETIISLFEDSNGGFWAGSYSNGMAYLDRKSGAYTYIPSLTTNRVKCIAEDKQKNIYVALMGRGLRSYRISDRQERTLGFQTGKQETTICNQYLNVLMHDSDSLLWIGHYSGIDCYNTETDRVLTLDLDSTLRTSFTYALLEDSKKNIWIGTNKGLFNYNKVDGSFTQYTMKDGLCHDVVCGLAMDSEGNIWCSTFQGLSKLTIENQGFVNYYLGNGLENKEYSRGIYAQTKSGVLLFGSNEGITHFVPSALTTTQFNKELTLTRMVVGGKKVTQQTRSGGKPIIEGLLEEAAFIRLSYLDNTFTLCFSTLDYREPENLSYEYRLLTTADEKWLSTMPGVNQVTFNHLSPGKYRLEVRTVENGIYTPTRTIDLLITPPWYRSAWAYVLYTFISISLLVLLFWVLRRKRRDEINEAKLRFFINMSHEFRSPITLIISPLESLLKQEYDTNTMRSLRGMYKNANRMMSLVNQLLDIRKIDKGQMRISCSETNLVDFTKEICSIYDYQAQKKQINLSFEAVQEHIPVWIDKNHFDKIVVNLLSNAFKFVPDGGEIAVKLSIGQNPSGKFPLKEYVEITVTDSGTGINEKQLKKIFERFYQGDSLIGYGIGLNLSRMLVELHRGVIFAANRIDATGSIFTVHIPLGNAHLTKEEILLDAVEPQIDSSNKLALVEKPEKRSYVRKKTNYKVLVVDDDEEICNFLQTELSESYRVLICNNGMDALQTAQSKLPDLIISDVVMPELDGLTLLKRLKSDAVTSHIPIILLTSEVGHNARIKGFDKGADAYVGKPFNLEELEVRIASLIANRTRLKGKFTGAQEQEDKLNRITVKSNDDVLIERIMKVINEQLSNSDFNVAMLADEVGLSRVQLHRRMKELTGISSADFIRNIRMKQAATLLRSGGVNVSQVSYMVGFSNNAHFSTAFKKYFGMSPSEYSNAEQ